MKSHPLAPAVQPLRKIVLFRFRCCHRCNRLYLCLLTYRFRFTETRLYTCMCLLPYRLLYKFPPVFRYRLIFGSLHDTVAFFSFFSNTSGVCSFQEAFLSSCSFSEWIFHPLRKHPGSFPGSAGLLLFSRSAFWQMPCRRRTAHPFGGMYVHIHGLRIHRNMQHA